MNEKRNFVFFSLCDNDFGWMLKEAAEYIFKQKEGVLSEEDFHDFAVMYVTFRNSVRRINPLLKCTTIDASKHTHDYLTKRLTVTFREDRPMVDHDGGSAVLDMHTGQAWCI